MLSCLLLVTSLIGAPGAMSDSPAYRVIVNIPERVLRVYSVDGPIDDFTPVHYQFPIAVGLRAFPTPVMSTAIFGRNKRPAWNAPRKSWAGEHAGRVVPFDSSANPFRARNSRGAVEGYFISLSDGIGFHSTSHPKSIGKLASHGCIRMKLEHVRKLFNELPDGTSVEIVYDLYRVERDTRTGNFAVRAFQDVYKRLTDEQNAAALLDRKSRHAIPISAPVVGHIESESLEEKTIQLPMLDPAILPIKEVPMGKPPQVEPRSSVVVIRSIPPVTGSFSKGVVIVNLP